MDKFQILIPVDKHCLNIVCDSENDVCVSLLHVCPEGCENDCNECVVEDDVGKEVWDEWESVVVDIIEYVAEKLEITLE